MTIQLSLLALAAILYVAGAFRLTRAAVGRYPRSRGHLLAGSLLVLVAAAWVGIGLVRPVPDNPAPGLAVAHAVTYGLRIAGACLFLIGLPILIGTALPRPDRRPRGGGLR
jgi:hypothetical protein